MNRQLAAQLLSPQGRAYNILDLPVNVRIIDSIRFKKVICGVIIDGDQIDTFELHSDERIWSGISCFGNRPNSIKIALNTIVRNWLEN